MAVFLLDRTNMSNSFSEKVTSTNLCNVLAYVIPRFYQKTGLQVYFKAHLDKKDNEFKIDIGFKGLDNPSNEIYEKFLVELKEAEKMVQNHAVLSSIHKYTTLEQFKTKYEQEAIAIATKHQKR